MGFNKRVLKKENILNNLHNLEKYFNADAIVCTDNFSMQVYNLYRTGVKKEQIINYINKIK